ncbi:MAG: UDP-glucose 4-epimerase GalE [Verrucomicrobia bacterium]|nr:UDP-glucose 4-epimerase GalE [Verrucomicrobiota bacterium]MDA1087959.1 UDP-glucose 4-epimerase GalE [Verrucomicrobiota bacterium]
MKVFVTGGAGYIGSINVECLLDAGHEVITFDNFEAGHRGAVDPRARLIEGDLRDFNSVSEVVSQSRPDAVMHFAAYALVGESMEKPEKYFRNNIMGTANLLEAMHLADVRRFVFSSTCATYGEPDTIPISESTPQHPVNPYGDSKFIVERLLGWYARCHSFCCTSLRYFNAAGASGRFGEDHDPESHLIPLVLQVALGQRDSIRIFGDDYDTPDGSCIRDYIHIRDLASAHMLALDRLDSGAFNLGNGGGYSVREVVEIAREITGHDIPAEVVARRPGDPARLIADASLARAQLGWTPAIPELSDIIQSAWDWHQAHPTGYGD